MTAQENIRLHLSAPGRAYLRVLREIAASLKRLGRLIW